MRPCGGQRGPDGQPVRIVPLDSTIIQHPRVWEASGHVASFNDPMIDCRETKARYRYDHVSVYVPTWAPALFAAAPAEGDAVVADRRGETFLCVRR